MRKKKIYLHIGTHKTGSTFIQNTLEDIGNEKLKKEDTFYINKPNFYYSGITKKEVFDKKIVSTIKTEINKIIKKNENVNNFILSNEWFSGHYDYGYKNASVISEMLYYALNMYDVKILVYLRRQDEFLESLYTQLIHQGGSLTFDEFLNNLPDNSFNWNNLILGYEKYFGKENIFPVIYSNKRQDFDIQKNFSWLIRSNLFLNHDTNEMSANKGYSRKALEIALRLNKYLPNSEKKSLRQYLQQHHHKTIEDSYNYMDIYNRNKLLNQYEKSNQELIARYSKILNKKKFPEINKNLKDENIDLSLDEVTDIIGKWISLKGIHSSKDNSISNLIYKLLFKK